MQYVMRHFGIICICSWFVFAFSPVDEAEDLNIGHKIVGKWYLRSQEMYINGKQIDEHFEEMAVHLSSRTGRNFNPSALAHKFRRGFKGIPSGTVFYFKDDYSYEILLPDQQIQKGMWRVKNAQTIVLNAQDKEMHVEIRSLENEEATISIKEEKSTTEVSGGHYMRMELVMDLSR